MKRILAVVFAATAVVALAPTPTPARAHHTTTDCADDQRCEFVSPSECAAGNHTGAADGGPPGRGSVCVGTAGHNVLYVGGEPAQLCGAVIAADVSILDGPTTREPSDPNHCPYFGWPTEVHDPAITFDGRHYYVFGTGAGVPIWRSKDLRTWTAAGRVFAGDLPPWATVAVPGATAPWAPDISFYAGRWHLYYAVSTFGAKRSAIGVATSATLRGGWVDHGVVVESGDTTDYNAIDPNVIVDASGQPWLSFGSFNSGIKIVALDPATGKPAEPTLRTVASRAVPTWGIEAPFVVRRAGYYYLFVSFDYCCRGTQSTYNIRVGRSRSVLGPYVDDRGVPLLAGGGRLVLESRGTRRGPGHNAVLNDGKRSLLVFHYYDGARDGTARLGIIPLRWTRAGWPVADWSKLAPTRFAAN